MSKMTSIFTKQGPHLFRVLATLTAKAYVLTNAYKTHRSLHNITLMNSSKHKNYETHQYIPLFVCR